jgi:hypothetical protein
MMVVTLRRPVYKPRLVQLILRVLLAGFVRVFKFVHAVEVSVQNCTSGGTHGIAPSVPKSLVDL